MRRRTRLGALLGQVANVRPDLRAIVESEHPLDHVGQLGRHVNRPDPPAEHAELGMLIEGQVDPEGGAHVTDAAAQHHRAPRPARLHDLEAAGAGKLLDPLQVLGIGSEALGELIARELPGPRADCGEGIGVVVGAPSPNGECDLHLSLRIDVADLARVLERRSLAAAKLYVVL